MFGGQNVGSYLADLWWYTPSTNIWEQKASNVVNTSYCTRANYAACWDGFKAMFHGGVGESEGIGATGGSGDRRPGNLMRRTLLWYRP